jgi:hypothetical protein
MDHRGSLSASDAAGGNQGTVAGRQERLFTARQQTVLHSTMMLLGALLLVDVFLQLNTPHSFVMLLLLSALGISYAYTLRAWSKERNTAKARQTVVSEY